MYFTILGSALAAVLGEIRDKEFPQGWKWDVWHQLWQLLRTNPASCSECSEYPSVGSQRGWGCAGHAQSHSSLKCSPVFKRDRGNLQERQKILCEGGRQLLSTNHSPSWEIRPCCSKALLRTCRRDLAFSSVLGAAHWDSLLELCVLGWAVGRRSISQWKSPCLPLMEIGSDLRSLKPCTGGGAELDDPGRHGSAHQRWSERYWKLWWRRRAWEERHRSTVQHASLWQVSSALFRRLKTYSGKRKPKALHLKELPAWKADSLHWRQARQQSCRADSVLSLYLLGYRWDISVIRYKGFLLFLLFFFLVKEYVQKIHLFAFENLLGLWQGHGGLTVLDGFAKGPGESLQSRQSAPQDDTSCLLFLFVSMRNS